MNTLLTIFPAPLLRLILCGGNGLPPAWGPMHHVHTHEDEVYPWDPVILAASSLPSHLRDDEARIEMWSIPLDADSPWPARLALVAAWMASAWMPAGVSAEVIPGECWLHLYTYSGGVADIRAWACNDGGNIEPGAVQLDSPTLPQYLQTHPPTVALLLALYDVPEIRARVEQT